MAAKKKMAVAEDVRHAVFIQIIVMLAKMDSAQVEDTALEAGISKSTLYFWMAGTTKNPHINTLSRVAMVLGYEIVLQKKGSKAKLYRIK